MIANKNNHEYDNFDVYLKETKEKLHFVRR